MRVFYPKVPNGTDMDYMEVPDELPDSQISVLIDAAQEKYAKQEQVQLLLGDLDSA